MDVLTQMWPKNSPNIFQWVNFRPDAEALPPVCQEKLIYSLNETQDLKEKKQLIRVSNFYHGFCLS